MKINLTSVFVDDQAKAIKFYTEVLGFIKTTDQRMGESWLLTVASPENPTGTQLLLEPNDFPAARTYQKALYEAGIPATSFGSDDVQAEYDRLTSLGVAFTTKPTKAPWGTHAIFDDTCGNLIQIHQG